MAQHLGSVDDFIQHVRAYGVPSADLPLAVRQAYQAAGLAIPAIRQQVALVLPPQAGVCTLDGSEQASGVVCPEHGNPHSHCAHCGDIIPVGQHQRAHAVAMMEHVTHPDTGAPLRLRVDHCDRCLETAACKADQPTPGSGHVDQPAGFCEPIEEA